MSKCLQTIFINYDNSILNFLCNKTKGLFFNNLFKDILKNLNIHNFRIIGINIKFTWQWGFQSQFTNQNNYERQFLISVE